MVALDRFINECLEESKVDYVGLWQIAQTTRERFGAYTTEDARELSLKVVRRLYEKGLRPGDYWGSDFNYWPDEGCQAALDRIEREWIEAGADPNLAEPICWFAPHPG
ncbi:MAG TPA: hypothetical protein VGP52_07700 [Stellaceae bacterium]|jgi:hypothetical protein|nr:hypothetical protein [Stellaceae bacterium]